VGWKALDTQNNSLTTTCRKTKTWTTIRLLDGYNRKGKRGHLLIRRRRRRRRRYNGTWSRLGGKCKVM